MTIEAVLWDYGGVFTPSPFGAAHSYASSEGTDPDELVAIVFGPYDSDTDHAWHRLERGEMSFVDALREIADDARSRGVPFDSGKLFSAMAGDDVDRTVVVEAVRTVRSRGVRTAIVTNNIREYGDAWRASLAIEELFDLVVDSSEEGVRKPNPEIFHVTLHRLGVNDPSRAVFLDDYEGNVRAARELGMHGILVGPDPRPAIEELLALLGIADA